MAGGFEAASAEPVQVTLVPPRFFRAALTELESMREQELDAIRSLPVELVIPLGRLGLLRRAASIGGG